MREIFLPLLSCLATSLRPPRDLATHHDTAQLAEMCRVAASCKEVTDNKTFSKELAKAGLTWQLFLRSSLRHSLRLGQAGEASLSLLTEVLAFLSSGGRLQEATSIVELVHSHSLYLPTLLGPSCGLKTALVRLLLALAPASLQLDQLPLLLSAYSATLHPSDTALLSLLREHEAAGLELGQFQPLMWGPSATSHYSGAGWKAPVATELLALLDREKVAATCDSFPLHLAMEQEEEVEQKAWTLYDPRYIQPLLSHLF